MNRQLFRAVLGVVSAAALAGGSFAATEKATAALILYNDATASLTPGWVGNTMPNSSITEITTDSAYEGTKCLDFQYTTVGGGSDVYAFCAIEINELVGVDLTLYDSLKLAYRQTNTVQTPEVEFQFCDNSGDQSLPPDAADVPLPQTTAWKVYSVPLSHWNDVGYGSRMNCAKSLYLKCVNVAGSGHMLIDDVMLVPAGVVSVQNQPVSAQPVIRSMRVSAGNRTIDFAVKVSGTISVYDLVGNQLAALHATHSGLSWTAPSTGTYLVRFTGAGVVETQRLLVR